MKKRKKQACAWGEHVYRAAPSRAREGWIASACIKCGKFLGRTPRDEFSCEPSGSAPGGCYARDQVAYEPLLQTPKRKVKRSFWN